LDYEATETHCPGEQIPVISSQMNICQLLGEDEIKYSDEALVRWFHNDSYERYHIGVVQSAELSKQSKREKARRWMGCTKTAYLMTSTSFRKLISGWSLTNRFTATSVPPHSA